MLQTERVAIRCRAAVGPEELAAHHAIRHRVFVEEQHIFARSDVDGRDASLLTIHVVGLVDGVIGGAVRLYPLGADGTWQGDRLAVLREFRARGLGAPLVRYAVRTAGKLGGRVMVAHIQLPNVRFFETLGWRSDGEIETYAGLPHQPMAIDLTPAPR
jgi:putative N-acetyltransferase (TIGR04045 family)